MTKKIKVLIDYPVESSYTGQTFPHVLYNELKRDERFEVLIPNNTKDFKKIDVIIIFAGGNHYKFFDDFASSFFSLEIVKKILNKFHKQISWLGYFLSLDRLNYYNKLIMPNFAYEKRLQKIIKNNRNIKVIHRLDGMYKIICKNYGVDKSVERLNKMSDLTVHQSEYSKNIWNNDIKTIFGKQKNLEIINQVLIPNGVDTELFNSFGERKELKGKWKILHVSASSNPNKNLKIVLEIANILKDNEEFQFYLIGKQLDDPICGKDIKRFNNCHYIGSLKSREEIAKYYRSCNLLLFPAKDDCSPNVILEAMSSGLPVVTLNSGGNLEIIQKGQLKGGVILEEKNPILSLKTIIDNYQNFQKDTLKIIKDYHDISITIEKYKKEILNLVSKNVNFQKN